MDDGTYTYNTVNGYTKVNSTPDGKVDYYIADIKSAQDFYPFGFKMPGRKFSATTYRFGFNGKEEDDEVSGDGNQYDYGFRIYNPRLGRFLSVDPLMNSFPWYTPYQFAGNMPIWCIDLDGLEDEKSTILNVVRLFDIKGNLIKDPRLVEFGCTGCTMLVAPSVTTIRQGDEGGGITEYRTDYRQVEGNKFTITQYTVSVSAHKIPTPEPADKDNLVQSNEPEKITGISDKKPEVSWKYGILTTATANMGTKTITTPLTKDIDVDFVEDRPEFKPCGAAAINDYIKSLPSGTLSLNIKVTVNVGENDCIRSGRLWGCNYTAKELMADRIKLISPIFDKLGIPVIIDPVYKRPQSVSATAQVNTTTATTTPDSWKVTKQPVKQKTVGGKPVGKVIPAGKATTTTSPTKPKTGVTF